MRGRYEDALASGTAPRVFVVLGGRCFDLQSAYQTAFADFLCFIIRKRRLAYGGCIGFTNGEYRIAIVDFIVALRRTKGRGRRTLRSPPSPSSGLHLIHPGLSAAAGKCRLPRGWGNLGSLYPVLSFIPSSECCAAICVRAGIVRVSVGVLGLRRSFFIIGWKKDAVCMALTHVF